MWHPLSTFLWDRVTCRAKSYENFVLLLSKCWSRLQSSLHFVIFAQGQCIFFFFCEDWYTKRCDRLIRHVLESSHNSLSKFGSCLTRYFKIVVLANRFVSTFSFCDHKYGYLFTFVTGECYDISVISLFSALCPSMDEKDEWVRVNSLNWHSLRLLTLLVPRMIKINFLLTISMHNEEKRLWELMNNHHRKNALIFYKILSTNSVPKEMYRNYSMWIRMYICSLGLFETSRYCRAKLARL